MEEKPSPGLFDLMALGIASAIMIGVGLAAGVGIDDWLHSSPLATLLGLLFGLVAAVGNFVHQIRRFL
jgi:F0F1-type ATP synthase assembly protein I